VQPFQPATSAVGSFITNLLGRSKCMPSHEGVGASASHTDAFDSSSNSSSPEDEIDEAYKSVQPFQPATSAVGSFITNLLGLSKCMPSHEGVGASASRTDAFDSSSNSSSPESSPPRALPLANGISSSAACCKDLRNLTESIGNRVQVCLSQVPPCFGTRRSSAPDKDQHIEDGMKVKIVNLKRATNLNGKVGEVLCFDKDSGRYQVKIFSLRISPACHASSSSSSSCHNDMKLLKGNNLQVFQSTMCSQPIVESTFI